MNLYEKLQSMRVELQQMNIKKTGKNKFAGYEYYELSDVLPAINELQAKYKTCSFTSFDSDTAKLTITNAEKPDEQIIFTSPMAGLNLKGAHEIQNLGGIQTYSRRYLYLNAFEITENDYFDCVQGKDQKQKPLSAQTREELNKQILKYATETQKPMEKITQELSALVKMPLQNISEDQSKILFEYLKKKSN